MRRLMARHRLLAAALVAALLAGGPSDSLASAGAIVPSAPVLPVVARVPMVPSCTAPALPPAEAPDYYAIELVPTGRVPGTRLSSGVAYQTAAVSPFFGVALAPSGEYLHDLDIRVEGLRPPAGGAYVAWATDTEVEEIVRLGELDAELRVRGRVSWNKFLVVITREPAGAPGDTWQGPIIMRGMSRSGRMHTLAGHGPFQAEPCAKYGFR